MIDTAIQNKEVKSASDYQSIEGTEFNTNSVDAYSPFSSEKNSIEDLLFKSGSIPVKSVNDIDFFKETRIDPAKKVYTDIGVFYNRWKDVGGNSARVVEVYDEVVVLECLIDKEFSIYEEREFDKGLFAGFELFEGKPFFIRYFERPNEQRVQVIDDERLIAPDDFPPPAIKDIISKSRISKLKLP
jgi:hypothetical protein